MTNPNHTDTSSSVLVANMRDTIREWERDEPRDDWFLHQHDFAEAADLIEQLEREKAVVSDLWEQQKEIALGYLADCNALSAENERLREELAAAYIELSDRIEHASDCATSNAPAMKPGPCDCAALGEK